LPRVTLREVGGSSWLERLDRDQLDNDAQNLAEIRREECAIGLGARA